MKEGIRNQSQKSRHWGEAIAGWVPRPRPQSWKRQGNRFPLELLEGTQPCQHLGFSPLRPIWTADLNRRHTSLWTQYLEGAVGSRALPRCAFHARSLRLVGLESGRTADAPVQLGKTTEAQLCPHLLDFLLQLRGPGLAALFSGPRGDRGVRKQGV